MRTQESTSVSYFFCLIIIHCPFTMRALVLVPCKERSRFVDSQAWFCLWSERGISSIVLRPLSCPCCFPCIPCRRNPSLCGVGGSCCQSVPCPRVSPLIQMPPQTSSKCRLLDISRQLFSPESPCSCIDTLPDPSATPPGTCSQTSSIRYWHHWTRKQKL